MNATAQIIKAAEFGSQRRHKKGAAFDSDMLDAILAEVLRPEHRAALLQMIEDSEKRGDAESIHHLRVKPIELLSGFRALFAEYDGWIARGRLWTEMSDFDGAFRTAMEAFKRYDKERPRG